MKSIQEMFPRASKSFIEANPLSSPSTGTEKLVQPIVATRRGKMNKTENEFSLILESRKRKGEIVRWEFEPMTLRFAGVRYTPDFLVIDLINTHSGEVEFFKFIEVKGGYMKGKFERAVERFRHAKTYWPEFTFELHQKSKEGWKQLL